MTCSWGFKENYLKLIKKDFPKHQHLKHTNKINIEHESLDKIMYNILFDLYGLLFYEFYLMVLTLTVVGYGDSISMPDLTYFNEDYTLFTLTMLAGWLGFSLFNSHIISIIESIKEPVTALKIQNDMVEGLEVFFVINNSQMKNQHNDVIREVELQKQCQALNLSFQQNYKAIRDHEFFIEMP